MLVVMSSAVAGVMEMLNPSNLNNDKINYIIFSYNSEDKQYSMLHNYDMV